jgi:hypothetical protein
VKASLTYQTPEGRCSSQAEACDIASAMSSCAAFGNIVICSMNGQSTLRCDLQTSSRNRPGISLASSPSDRCAMPSIS